MVSGIYVLFLCNCCTIWLGAGKTTTFNMLTGDIRPSSGTAIIAGYDIVGDIRKVHITIPYTLYITYFTGPTTHWVLSTGITTIQCVYVLSCVLCSLML